MKMRAAGLLVLAAVAFGISHYLRARYPWLGWVQAFSEAAMVGAIADWFAVVALFRHPLGIPIPHTAIIPNNKDRIGENLAGFILANFLGTPQLLAKLRQFDAAARIADWLADARHASQLAEHLSGVLRYAVDALDDARVRRFLQATLRE